MGDLTEGEVGGDLTEGEVGGLNCTRGCVGWGIELPRGGGRGGGWGKERWGEGGLNCRRGGGWD